MKISGIRIGASYSWFVVLFLLIWLLSDYFTDITGNPTTGYVLAASAAFLFFASLILHELGHALAARREGIRVVGIDLWFFGGVANMSRDALTPGEEFRVAAAGPAVTVVIVVVCTAAAFGLGQVADTWNVATFQTTDGDSAIVALVGYLAAVNLFLLVFNLLPAFPLDGGRIARSIVWKLTNDRHRATRVSGYTGQGLAYLMMGIGLVQAFVFSDTFSGLWLAVLGWFLASAARSAVVSTKITEKLAGIRVADIMDGEPVAIPGDTTALRAHDEWFLRYGWEWFPVVDASGRFLGLVRSERVDSALGSGQPLLTVDELVDDDTGAWRVGAHEPIEVLLGRPELMRLGALMAVDSDGLLRGVVTTQQVQRAVTAALPGHGR